MSHLETLISQKHHDGLCENCDEPIPLQAVREGDLGWYCSDKCMLDAEDYDGMSEAQCRAWERRQMGIGS